MLRAIIHGKAGRIDSNGENVTWRHLFKSREDLLTAAIFTRWSYLSAESKHTLLQNWIKDFEITDSDYKDIEFWAKFDLEVEGREFVEPDVLIRFKDFNVLIEVKPPKGGSQKYEQWNRELEGYFSSEDLPVHFLAIGRNTVNAATWKNKLLEKNNHLESIITKSWKSVAESIYNLTKHTDTSLQDNQILSDMIEALKIYGVIAHPYKWSDFNKQFANFRSINLTSISKFSDSKITPTNGIEIKALKKHAFTDLMINDLNINLEVIAAWKR